MTTGDLIQFNTIQFISIKKYVVLVPKEKSFINDKPIKTTG